MRRALAALAAAALIATPILAQEAVMPPDTEIAQILADRIDRDQANIGIAVAVIEGGKTRFISHGTLSRADPIPVDEFTAFEAGSITKVMTSLVLAQLALEGRIDLDAPILDYLPAGTMLPEADGRSISAFDLASHMSGLTGLPETIIESGIDNPYSGYGGADLMAWLRQQQLAHPIGETFEYSNVGIALLGQAIEHVTSQSYAEVIAERVFAPLGMTGSSLSLSAEKPQGMAIGHDAAGEVVSYWDFDAVAPAGALVTSASDLAKFIAAASGAEETALRPAFDKMLERTRPIDETVSIGLGWIVTTTDSGEIVWHNGQTGGFRSFAGFDRNSGNGVVVLSNMVTEAGIEDIGMHLLDNAIPLRSQPEPRVVAAIDSAILPALAGDYLLAPGLTISVTTEHDRLFAQLTGQQRFEIFPESARRFFYRVVDAQITFADPVDGTSPSLMLHQNGQNMTAVRLP